MNKPQQEADWTILIYANGNNELAPEMWQGMLAAEKVGSSANVHVVMQIGRAEYKLVKLIRSDVSLTDEDSWNGVRRYVINKGNSDLVGNLNKINMAHPKQLYQFLKWGMLSYPAKKYMLVLSGHSYNCVGMMTDYSKKAPYIMGIPEMTSVINTAANQVGKKIDILLLDTCGANSLETIYEFGKDENHAVRSILTYIVSGPIEGLPYDRIIHFVQANSSAEDITIIIKDIVENLPYDLISFEIDHQKLRKIKQLFHNKTMKYQLKNMDSGQSNFKLSALERKNIIQSVSDYLTSMIIYYKRIHENLALITVTASVTNHLKLLNRYVRLGFAQDNLWASLINDRPADIKMDAVQKENLLPLKMSPQEVYAYISIMNPELSSAQKSDMLEKLYRYKKWV